MDELINKRYGSLKDIKYLVTSLSDLKETVDTVKSIIETGCEEKDIIRVAESVSLEFVPLKNTLSSFILGLKIPHRILASKYRRNVDKFQISTEDQTPLIKKVKSNTIISYKLNSFLDLAQTTTQFLVVLQKITPRVEFYSIKKKIVIKAGKLLKNSDDNHIFFVIQSTIIDPSHIESLINPQKQNIIS